MRLEITDRKRFIFAIIFGAVLIATHLLWRIIIDTGMENLEYQKKLKSNTDIGILAKSKDAIWNFISGEKPDRTNTDIRYIAVMGHDLSGVIEPICKTTLLFAVPVCNWFKDGFIGYTQDTPNGKRFILENTGHKGSTFEIVWGCTSIKQIVMFFFIMITTFGRLTHRMTYFIICIPVIGIFNIFRIAAVTSLSVGDIASFSYWHDNVFRIIYYIFIFALWLLWAEVITKRLYKS